VQRYSESTCRAILKSKAFILPEPSKTFKKGLIISRYWFDLFSENIAKHDNLFQE
jgi:hypothetical protein